MRTDGSRRRQLGRYRRQIPTPVLALLIGCVATILPTMGRSTTSAQARLAALPVQPAAPADNPSTPERVALGRLLFWDPILSGQKDVACATCHHPSLGYADGLDLSIGANGVGLGRERSFLPERPQRIVKRNSQTVLNVAFNGLTSGGMSAPRPRQCSGISGFARSRRRLSSRSRPSTKCAAALIQRTALSSAVVARLNGNRDYRRMFARAFGGSTPVNDANLGRALAAFQRTLVATNTPFDRYMRGDTTAMTPDQVRGMDRFQQIGCVNCHNGPMFSDFAAHVLAVPDSSKLPESDSGVNKLRLPHAIPAQPGHHRAVHAQWCVRDTSRRRRLLPPDQSRRRTSRRWRRRREGYQPAGGAGSDRSAGPPAEHARAGRTGSRRVPPSP